MTAEPRSIQGDPTRGRTSPGTRAYTERPRRIPPELARDELLELGCSVLAALLLYRLIAASDDQGRLPGDPRFLRSTLLGMRDDITSRKVDAAVRELVDAGFVIAYEVGGRKLVQVANWWALQGSYMRRAYASSYPAPPRWADRVFQKPSEKPADDDSPSADELSADEPQGADELSADEPQGADELSADDGMSAAAISSTYSLPFSNTGTNTHPDPSTVTGTLPGTSTDPGAGITAPPAAVSGALANAPWNKPRRNGGVHPSTTKP